MKNKVIKKTLIMVLVVIVLFVALLLLFGRGNNVQEDWSGELIEKIPYSDVSEADYLNLYLPESDEKLPLMILVHGGGFVYNDCTSKETAYMYEYFKTQGYACAAINYRLADEAVFPASVSDVKAAVRFLHANADKYGLDENRFIIWGESAGGYLATMAAVTNDEEFVDVKFIGEEEVAETSSRVSALIDFYGVTEMDKIDEEFKQEHVPTWIRKLTGESPDGTTAHKESFASLYMGKPIGELTDEERAMISPHTYIRENLSKESDLKVYIRHGRIDITVPHIQSDLLADEFCQAIGDENVDFDIYNTYKHADGRFYSKKNLEDLKSFLADL